MTTLQNNINCVKRTKEILISILEYYSYFDIYFEFKIKTNST